MIWETWLYVAEPRENAWCTIAQTVQEQIRYMLLHSLHKGNIEDDESVNHNVRTME